MATESNRLQDETKYAKQLELFFVKNKFGNVQKIAQHLGIHWLTAQKELTALVNKGRLHEEDGLYFLNGTDEWTKKIELNKNHTLFVDTFVTAFGENFVRIKETKKEGDEWKNMGNIIITKDKISEVREILKKIEENLMKTNIKS